MTPGLQRPSRDLDMTEEPSRPPPQHHHHQELPREMVFAKMERLVREMQHPETGVPVRSQKLFLSSIPYAFTGYDIVEWIMDRLGIDDYPEAVHLANLLCQHGYFFPVNDAKSLALKDDHALYRFQTPYFWPSHHQPDNTDYAIFLSKRTMRSKQKHALEEHEQEALLRLKKLLCHKWDFINMQAEEQANLAKDRKKTDKIVLDSQEKAYWRVHRPPPGFTSCLERSPILNRKMRRKRNKSDIATEVEILKRCLNRTSCKSSQGINSLIQHFEAYANYDPFISGCQPSNPWISEDATLWTLNAKLVDIPTEKRVRRWAISLKELLSDPTGVREFELYLQKEYSGENLRFWQAVQKYKRGSQRDVTEAAAKINEEHLSPGAFYEVNLDSKTVEETLDEASTKPTRTTFDAAQRHVYALMEKDTYPRFLRSEHYQNLLVQASQHPHKKKFFHFGTKKKMPPSPSQGKRCTGTGSPNGAVTGSGVPNVARAGSVLGSGGTGHSLGLANINLSNLFSGSTAAISAAANAERDRRLSSGQQLSGSNVDLTKTPKASEVFDEWPFCGRHSHSTSDLHSLQDNAGTSPSALSGSRSNACGSNSAFNKLAASSRLSSPSTSRECVGPGAENLGGHRGSTLQVPRWSHRSSDGDASTISSPEDSGTDQDNQEISQDPEKGVFKAPPPDIVTSSMVTADLDDPDKEEEPEVEIEDTGIVMKVPSNSDPTDCSPSTNQCRENV